MAALFPFRALRPTPSSAARVAAVPYDVVTAAEARTLGADPLNFLHVSRAEIDLPPDTNPHAEEVYARALANMAALTQRAPLVVEPSATVYVYRLRMGDHVQTGIAGCFGLDEYEGGLIKKHERTRRDKEDDRTRHMLELRAQTGPVFLTYRSSAAIAAITERVARLHAPLFDFEAADGIQHTVWTVEAVDCDALIAGFDDVDALYIADGHHRAASAARVRRRLREAGNGDGEWDTFLAVAFQDLEVQVLAYNRVVRDLGPFTADGLLEELRRRFVVSNGPPVPERRGQVAMFLGERWHAIAMGDPESTLAADRRLDVSRLQDLILTPLIGIGDVTTDKRIDFVGGIRGTAALEALVRSGHASAAFSMHPVRIDDIMEISDAGGIMPPKSTWFEPKLRDGLLSHVI
jgi:uncharacterized protein (DUF1015 family)